MSTKLTLLEVLNENTNTYLSGQQLADRLAWFLGNECAAWGNQTSQQTLHRWMD